jgi:translocation protein SEC62
MTDKGFYMWNVPKPRGKLALFLFIGFIIAIAFMLFHLWPMWLKIGIWYFSFYTLIVLVGFILLRLVVWLTLFHFGLDFWILPNFFIDSNDIMDSFRPALSFERRQDDLKMILLRLASAVALVFFVIQLAKEPDNLDSLKGFTKDSMDDLFNWGNDRFVLGRQIADKSGNSTVKRKRTPQEIFMEAILDEEELKKEEEPAK